MLQSHQFTRWLFNVVIIPQASILSGLMMAMAASSTGTANAQEATQNSLRDANQQTASLPESKRNFLQLHCFACHDSAKQEGQLDLENISFDLSSLESAERWQKILDAINSGEMPPKDSKQPEARAKAEFL